MFFLFAAFFLSIMNMTSIKILLPEIMSDLTVGLNWLTWVVNAYTLPMAILVPVGGRIGDIYGSRRFFLIGGLTLGVGSLVCGIAFSLSWLITGRVIQALGAALLVPNALAILLSRAEISKQSQILGIWGGIGAFGAVIGPVASGLFSDILSWRGAFMIVAVLAFLITLSAGKQMPAPERQDIDSGQTNKKKRGSFDMLGALTLMCAAAGLLLGITLLPDLGWHNTWVIMCMASFILMCFLFWRIEIFARDPLLNLHLLQNPYFNLGLSVGFIEQFAVAGTLFVMPIFFNSVQGHSAAYTALLLTPTAASVAIISPFCGHLTDRLGPGLPITAGMVLRCLSFIMLSQITTDTTYPIIALGLALNGIGFALSATPALLAVLSTATAERHGITTGVHNMFRFIGVASGTTIVGIVLYAFIPSSFEGFSGPIPGFFETHLLSAAVCLPGIAAGIYLIILGRPGQGKATAAQTSRNY